MAHATLLTIALIAALSVAPPTDARQREKHVFVTVLDRDGAPIAGLGAEHFAVRERGRDRQVVRAEPLRIPMHVAVLVDTSHDNTSPDPAYREAVRDFVERLAAFNRVAVYSFGERAARVADFSSDAAALRAAMTGMYGRAEAVSYLIDAIDLALADMKAIEIPRPVIVAITAESAEASRRSAGSVIKRLIAQSVGFHAISMTSTAGTATAGAVRSDIPTSSRRLQGMIALGEGDRERTQILQQGTTATGGSVQRVTSALALPAALTRLSRELASAYLVAFDRPGSSKLEDLQVGVMIEGVTLRATAAPFGTR